jgi:hypothetical protein
VDTTTVQRIDAPTRDIYVERTLDGDRVFAGFGLPSHQYCDCSLDADKLPKDILSVSGGLCGLAWVNLHGSSCRKPARNLQDKGLTVVKVSLARAGSCSLLWFLWFSAAQQPLQASPVVKLNRGFTL